MGTLECFHILLFWINYVLSHNYYCQQEFSALFIFAILENELISNIYGFKLDARTFNDF